MATNKQTLKEYANQLQQVFDYLDNTRYSRLCNNEQGYNFYGNTFSINGRQVTPEILNGIQDADIQKKDLIANILSQMVYYGRGAANNKSTEAEKLEPLEKEEELLKQIIKNMSSLRDEEANDKLVKSWTNMKLEHPGSDVKSEYRKRMEAAGKNTSELIEIDSPLIYNEMTNMMVKDVRSIFLGEVTSDKLLNNARTKVVKNRELAESYIKSLDIALGSKLKSEDKKELFAILRDLASANVHTIYTHLMRIENHVDDMDKKSYDSENVRLGDTAQKFKYADNSALRDAQCKLQEWFIKHKLNAADLTINFKDKNIGDHGKLCFNNLVKEITQQYTLGYLSVNRNLVQSIDPDKSPEITKELKVLHAEQDVAMKSAVIGNDLDERLAKAAKDQAVFEAYSKATNKKFESSMPIRGMFKLFARAAKISALMLPKTDIMRCVDVFAQALSKKQPIEEIIVVPEATTTAAAEPVETVAGPVTTSAGPIRFTSQVVEDIKKGIIKLRAEGKKENDIYEILLRNGISEEKAKVLLQVTKPLDKTFVNLKNKVKDDLKRGKSLDEIRKEWGKQSATNKNDIDKVAPYAMGEIEIEKLKAEEAKAAAKAKTPKTPSPKRGTPEGARHKKSKNIINNDNAKTKRNDHPLTPQEKRHSTKMAESNKAAYDWHKTHKGKLKGVIIPPPAVRNATAKDVAKDAVKDVTFTVARYEKYYKEIQEAKEAREERNRFKEPWERS